MPNVIKIINPDNDGQYWFWNIREHKDADDEIGVHIASGDSDGYDTRDQALKSLFSVFFGVYDNDAFMALYGEWQESVKLAKTPGRE